MKRYELLLAWPVIEQMNALPKGRRQRLGLQLLKLEESPDLLSEFASSAVDGRRLDVLIFDGWAVFYWIDFADRHVKVLDMKPADHVERG
jgi:hypothetical protein